MFEIRLRKESFKFSSAHFTVFSARKAERLHGHNYYVTAVCRFDKLNEQAMACDFQPLKEAIQSECDRLDEFVLLPEKSPHVKISSRKKEIEALFASRRYVFPADDVRLLPLINVSCEALADHLCSRLAEKWKKLPRLREILVEVEETRGQSAAAARALGRKK